jgi:hypothetical protein
MIDTQQIAERLKAANEANRLPEAIASEILAAQSQGELVIVPVLKATIAEVRLEISAMRDQLTKEIHNISSRILWPVGTLALITWLLQIFGTAVRHLFGQL